MQTQLVEQQVGWVEAGLQRPEAGGRRRGRGSVARGLTSVFCTGRATLLSSSELPIPTLHLIPPYCADTQDNYIQSRSTAIESIESTIAELGQIFSQLANMVAEQRETVQRIDADVTDISANVSGAQRELLKYYASISSNRWLMLKIFGVLIIFVSPRRARRSRAAEGVGQSCDGGRGR